MTGPLELYDSLTSPQGYADPYPVYARLRSRGQLLDAGGDFLIATSYAAVTAMLRDPAFGVTEAGIFDGQSLLRSNPPEHTRMRRAMSGVFTPRRVNGLRAAIRQQCHDLIDRMREGGEQADLMSDFAYRLPVNVICELLGVPDKDRDWFRPVASDYTAILEGTISEDETMLAFDAGTMIRKYFAYLVRERADNPRGDLISVLARDGAFTGDELLSNLALLLVAGFETTTNLIGNGIGALFEHPDAMAGLAERPNDYVEEFLRYDSPVQTTSRIALQPTVLLGRPIPQGTFVMALIGSANRDPQRFGDPDRFDPSRPNNVPISFGAGAHFCLGAALARLEAAIAFPLLLQRLPGLRRAGEPVRRNRLVLRGYESMPVAWN